MRAKLKPCPCCGKGACYVGGSVYYIICMRCRLQTTTYKRLCDASRAWNKRFTG